MRDAVSDLTSGIEWRLLFVASLFCGLGVLLLATFDAGSGPTTVALGGMGAVVAIIVMRGAALTIELEGVREPAASVDELRQELTARAAEYHDQAREALDLYLVEQQMLHDAEQRLDRLAAALREPAGSWLGHAAKTARHVTWGGQHLLAALMIAGLDRARVRRAYRKLTRIQARQREVMALISQLDEAQARRPPEGQESFAFPAAGGTTYAPGAGTTTSLGTLGARGRTRRRRPKRSQ